MEHNGFNQRISVHVTTSLIRVIVSVVKMCHKVRHLTLYLLATLADVFF